jgi:tRNA pseudouridine55 synthase
MRTRTRFRPLDGILLLDKPAGMSSNQALQRVRHLYRAEKAGHTGSLDPLATGLLPLCFGEATKIAGLLLGSHKAYETTARLGITTDTDDADGVVLRERAVPALSPDLIRAALQPFIGRHLQRAPIYSALKQGGERLYAMARRGEAVEAPEREVEVVSIQVLAFEGQQVRLRIECGSGTYVRSIVRDLGESLGCGAHVVELRRLWVEPFRAPVMATLGELQADAASGEERLDARLLPVEAGLAPLPRIDLDASTAARFAQGQRVPVDMPDAGAHPYAVHGPRTLLGLAEIEGGLLRPRRLFRWAVDAAAPPAA